MGQIWSFNKIIVFSAIASFIFGAGFLISESSAQVTPTCNGKPVTISGTPGNDFLKGGNGNDVIDGMGGHDLILGGNGDDTICAGPGKDFVYGGDGKDAIFTLDGEKEFVHGGNGKDFCQVDEREAAVISCETRAGPYLISSP